MTKVFIKTFGCRTNVFDTQVMLSHLHDYIITEDEAQADVVVVNSCTVTNGADSSVRTYINTLERTNPNAKAFLTGCGAHTKGATLLKENKVFGVFGQSEKQKIATLLQASKPFYEIGDLDFIDDNVVESFVGKSRAFIKIQEGCSFRCSYCIIPFVRGDARDLDETLILKQVRTLAENGFGEFILTGTNMGSFGDRSKGTSLPLLLQKMSLIRGVRRIRLGSLEPIQITDAFKELLDEPWMARHLHIALQHTSDEMLKIMNRRNRYEFDRALFEDIADRGYALGTDFIVGHPGETASIWEEAFARTASLPLTHVHAFTFSPREGTPSALRKDTVKVSTAKARLKQLTQLIEEKNYVFRTEHAHDSLDVLIESKKGAQFYGLDQYYNPVHVTSDDELEGNWIQLSHYDVLKGDTIGRF